jgi:excisionase family DNA binding protein
MDDCLLTVKEFCKKYAVSRFTVYKWVSLGLIPHIRLKNVIRFRLDDLKQWEESKLLGKVKVDLI